MKAAPFHDVFHNALADFVKASGRRGARQGFRLGDSMIRIRDMRRAESGENLPRGKYTIALRWNMSIDFTHRK
jgi:hypothetical protein